MNSELLKRILNCPELPSLPAVAARIIDLTADENVSIEDLAATIQNDQALAAKVLKTANSSFYGLREPCSTVPRALVMLGLRPVKTLALSFSLVGAVQASAGRSFNYAAYWRRALYTAIAARAVLERAGRKGEAEEAFLGGLLQDIGMLAMHAAIGPGYLELIGEVGNDHASLGRRELETYELQHADIGAMLASRWRLPEQLIMPVKFHDRPTAAPASCAPIVRAVAIGNLMHDALSPPNAVCALKRVYDRSRQWFAMLTDDADEIMRATTASVEELSRLFAINTGEVPDADEVLGRARAELERIRAGSPIMAAFADPSSILIDGQQIDEQTGVFNMRGFQSVVRSAVHLGAARSLIVSVVIAPVDNLAMLLRSAAPDDAAAAARHIVAGLHDCFSPIGGVVGRLADDLFGVVVTGAPSAVVAVRCDAFRAAFADPSPTPEAPPLAVSFGIAETDPAAAGEAVVSSERLMAAAARAAVQSGGNATRIVQAA